MILEGLDIAGEIGQMDKIVVQFWVLPVEHLFRALDQSGSSRSKSFCRV